MWRLSHKFQCIATKFYTPGIKFMLFFFGLFYAEILVFHDFLTILKLLNFFGKSQFFFSFSLLLNESSECHLCPKFRNLVKMNRKGRRLPPWKSFGFFGIFAVIKQIPFFWKIHRFSCNIRQFLSACGNFLLLIRNLLF